MPELAPTLATSILLLLQVPPLVRSVSAVDEPVHALKVPVIGNIGFTFTDAVAIQLKPPVKVMVAVPPAKADTMPVDDPTAATAVLLLLHTPPLASLSVVLVLAQRVVVPVMADGTLLIVISAVSWQPVGSL